MAIVLIPVLRVCGLHSTNHTTVKPPWPGKPFELACPAGTPQQTCELFGSAEGVRHRCYQPEPEVQEVLNSFLIDCSGCLYVDIGCNIGYFAAHAAALGATVECYEPTPSYVDAITKTKKLNGFSDERFRVHHNAIMASDTEATNRRTLLFDRAFRACNVALVGPHGPKSWNVQTLSIRQELLNRKVELLKIDIDSNEGALFHTITKMIMRNETSIETIIIEVGDNDAGGEFPCHFSKNYIKACHTVKKPRGGDVNDFRLLQRKYGYDVYRVNILVGGEIFDWTGKVVNKRIVPSKQGVLPMYSVRMMRKLEKVLPSMSLHELSELFTWGASFLVTRVQLAELGSKNGFDLEPHGLKGKDLNVGNPVYTPMF